MKIHNVRLGFANNSSSSHSLIFIKPGHNLRDEHNDREFGWDNFTLVSAQAKMDYLSMLLWYNLREVTTEDMAKAVMEKWSNSDLSVEGDEHYPDGYIDHQSVLALPRTWDEKGLDLTFFECLKAYILREDVAILGGNDNEKHHPLWSKAADASIPLQRDAEALSYVARFDPLYDYWTLFDRSDGDKIRLSFDHRRTAPPRASAPELVDLKITNYCPYGCQFCYQDSTLQGKHAPREHISKILYSLRKMKVFEVALGGGEPTLHPDFLNIIQEARKYGIVPNFTTKNLSWMSDSSFSDIVKANCGSFAFSANTGEEVMKLAAARKTYNLSNIPVTIQCVMGVVTSWDFYGILRACTKNDLTLTLLGYKDVGRGTEYTRKQEDEVISTLKRALKEKVFPDICVDTEFASKYEEELKKLKVPSWLYHTQEGKFSAYIDAVEGKIGPSSYCTQEEYKPLPDLPKDRYLSDRLTGEILQAFRGF